MERLERMPVPLLPTMVGAATLGNVYQGMGYVGVRHFTMWVATAIILVYIVKMIRFPKTVAGEYKQVVPSSLYAGFTMLLMILGSYYYDYVPTVGKAVWLAAVCIHAVHILVFTIRNVIMKRDINTFVPSWFVTYNGIMVSCVTGAAMNMKGMLTVITYYGISIYVIIIPIMIWRLIKVEVKPPVYHTMAIVLAPCSLCLVSYLNVVDNPNQALAGLLYAAVVISLFFLIFKLPAFFSRPFAPGYAGLTFPMAIGVVASTRMAGYLEGVGSIQLAGIVQQLSGFQVYLTTMIVGYVLLRFFMMFLKTEEK